MSDFEVCPCGTLQRLARVEAFASALRQQAEQSAQRLAAVEAERDSMREILDHIPQVEAELAETSDKLHAMTVERDALLEALRMAKEAAIEMRGDDFNLTAEQWAKVHAAIAKAEGGGNG